MRLAFLAACALPIVALAASAQPPKDVNVLNFPDPQNVTGSVEVTNDATNPVEISGEVAVTSLPTASPQVRFQLVGFTTAQPVCSNGLFPLTQACQSEFGGDVRMCTSVEVMETTSIPSGLSGWAMVRPVFLPTGDTASPDPRII